MFLKVDALHCGTFASRSRLEIRMIDDSSTAWTPSRCPGASASPGGLDSEPQCRRRRLAVAIFWLVVLFGGKAFLYERVSLLEPGVGEFFCEFTVSVRATPRGDDAGSGQLVQRSLKCNWDAVPHVLRLRFNYRTPDIADFYA